MKLWKPNYGEEYYYVLVPIPEKYDHVTLYTTTQ